MLERYRYPYIISAGHVLVGLDKLKIANIFQLSQICYTELPAPASEGDDLHGCVLGSLNYDVS